MCSPSFSRWNRSLDPALGALDEREHPAALLARVGMDGERPVVHVNDEVIAVRPVLPARTPTRYPGSSCRPPIGTRAERTGPAKDGIVPMKSMERVEPSA